MSIGYPREKSPKQLGDQKPVMQSKYWAPYLRHLFDFNEDGKMSDHEIEYGGKLFIDSVFGPSSNGLDIDEDTFVRVQNRNPTHKLSTDDKSRCIHDRVVKCSEHVQYLHHNFGTNTQFDATTYYKLNT